jgi:histidine triad (HIT) family protein
MCSKSVMAGYTGLAMSCLFCRIVDGSIPSTRVYEDDQCIAFADIHPQAPVHLLIVPREHIASLAKAAAEHSGLLGHLLWTATELAREKGLANGFRTVINTGADGGQTVDHLHVHLLGGRPMHWPPG